METIDKQAVNTNTEYIIVSDDDGHNYVIPANKKGAWFHGLDSVWRKYMTKNSKCGTLPEWCKKINGAISSVRFKNYRIEWSLSGTGSKDKQ